MIKPTDSIGVVDMAYAWGCSRSTARRKLIQIEGQYAGVVFRNEHGEIMTTPEAIAPFVRKTPESPLQKEVRRLREELEDEKLQKDALVREFGEFRQNVEREFRRLSSEWFRLSKR